MSDGWIDLQSDGRVPILHPDTLLEVDYRNGVTRETRCAAGMVWTDVTRYRIVRPPLDFHTSGAPVRADDVQVAGDHYKTLAVQPWAAMQAWMTAEQFRGFLLGSAIAYLGRFNAEAPGKGGIADVKKARHTLDKLIETMESQ